LAVPGQPSAFVDVKPGPPIGTNFNSPRQPTTVDFPPDAVAAFYTDGLVERRGEVLDVGLERLRHALTPGPPHRVAAQIMHEAIGGIVPTDDIALVVMSRSGPTPTR
jgi:serine phosphatase RsbU (regulator of sigma subunit)